MGKAKSSREEAIGTHNVLSRRAGFNRERERQRETALGFQGPEGALFQIAFSSCDPGANIQGISPLEPSMGREGGTG